MRTAYLLTTNQQSDRTQFSKKVLEKIGFNVVCFQAILNQDKVLSNKLSMMSIYDQIGKSDNEWAYVFEDDINMVEPIFLDEIIQYENISSPFFYLGCCMYNLRGETLKNTGHVINNYRVLSISGGVRGLHAIGISKQGAKELLDFAKASNKPYMDCILEDFSIIHPANIVRFDLMSPYIWGHRGVLFQDRVQFPSTI
jgi:hypothetical protein